jgi:hypothetical protein
MIWHKTEANCSNSNLLGEDFEVKCWKEGDNFYILFNRRLDLTNVMMGLKEMTSLFL